jgi:hypothetical protein
MGPFGSEREARCAADAAVDVYRDLSAGNRQMLDQACAAARVETGPYDHRILNWLAGYEPAMCAVVAGLISRANQAAPGSVTLSPAQLRIVLDALADAEVYREREGSTPCLACIDAPPSVGLCAEHGADFDAAQGYHDLSAGLTGGAS